MVSAFVLIEILNGRSHHFHQLFVFQIFGLQACQH
jgi:hypothetical protein